MLPAGFEICARAAPENLLKILGSRIFELDNLLLLLPDELADFFHRGFCLLFGERLGVEPCGERLARVERVECDLNILGALVVVLPGCADFGSHFFPFGLR